MKCFLIKAKKDESVTVTWARILNIYLYNSAQPYLILMADTCAQYQQGRPTTGAYIERI